MKIAILNIYSGLVNRGAETVAHALAKQFKKDHEVLLFAGGAINKAEYKVQIIPGVGVYRPMDNGLMSKLSCWLYRDANSEQIRDFTSRTMEELDKFDPDIILALNGSEQIRILHTSPKFVKKVVLCMQGQTESRRWKLAGRENWRIVSMQTAGLIAINQLQYNFLQNSVNKTTHITQIPNGVDLDFFNPEVNKTKLSVRAPVVLCVAGLQSYKRIDRLIKAVAKTNFGLLVMGDGPMRDELDLLGNQLLGRERFEIMTVPHELIPGVYAASDLFSLPSQAVEAFGVAYLEAMACNLAVVAPDDEVRREIVSEAGVYTDVEDVESYAQALNRAMSMSWKNIPRKQAMKFDWKEIADKYIDFFNQII